MTIQELQYAFQQLTEEQTKAFFELTEVKTLLEFHLIDQPVDLKTMGEALEVLLHDYTTDLSSVYKRKAEALGFAYNPKGSG